MSSSSSPSHSPCDANQWSAWTPCAYGTVSRNQLCDPTQTQTKPCYINDCVLSPWSAWTPCSSPCNGGSQTRSRTILTPPDPGGIPCGEMEQTQNCNPQPCDKNCTLSAWSDWGVCSANCGGGTQISSRQILTPPEGKGTCTDTLLQTQDCNTAPCSSSCQVSSWSEWSACDKACGGGTKTRTRKVITPGVGHDCPALEQTLECNIEPCAVDCVTSDWSAWSDCCNKVQQRTRSITQCPTINGTACPHLVETQACDSSSTTESCSLPTPEPQTPCNQNCEMSDWLDWSECTQTCSAITPSAPNGTIGMQQRQRVIMNYPSVNSPSCGSTIQTRPCNNEPCPVDCVVSDWSPWSECSAVCAPSSDPSATPLVTGNQTRTRTVLTPSANGGAQCPVLNDITTCSKNCVVDCQISPGQGWSAWNPSEWGYEMDSQGVVQKDEAGQYINAPAPTRTQNHVILVQPANGGKPCPPLTEIQSAADVGVEPLPPRTPVNCVMSPWTYPTGPNPCNYLIYGGTITNTRTVLQQPLNGGQTCPTDTTDTINCPCLPCNL